MNQIAEFGLLDDLLSLMGTPCENEAVQYIEKCLKEDIEAMDQKAGRLPLLAKWLPSVNTSNKEAVAKAKKIGQSAEYERSGIQKDIECIEKSYQID